ncbi:hypothetical protein SADUNF_Sadunf13G0071100 [Salix dunnii]|uniref:Uncharacterized protein n=1 Tax=Salix dunnii TaxID=1413687 RepID=A0A835MNF1_9ROSI|nr:hypothetical protein SADUNF_Sadunf13G0071100 [Salix dunnii]
MIQEVINRTESVRTGFSIVEKDLDVMFLGFSPSPSRESLVVEKDFVFRHTCFFFFLFLLKEMDAGSRYIIGILSLLCLLHVRGSLSSKQSCFSSF